MQPELVGAQRLIRITPLMLFHGQHGNREHRFTDMVFQQRFTAQRYVHVTERGHGPHLQQCRVHGFTIHTYRHPQPNVGQISEIPTTINAK